MRGVALLGVSLCLGSSACEWTKGADGSWGLFADVEIPEFSLTQAGPEAVFEIESKYTPEAFPEGRR